jgi:hypothetical protein
MVRAIFIRAKLRKPELFYERAMCNENYSLHQVLLNVFHFWLFSRIQGAHFFPYIFVRFFLYPWWHDIKVLGVWMKKLEQCLPALSVNVLALAACILGSVPLM